MKKPEMEWNSWEKHSNEINKHLWKNYSLSPSHIGHQRQPQLICSIFFHHFIPSSTSNKWSSTHLFSTKSVFLSHVFLYFFMRCFFSHVDSWSGDCSVYWLMQTSDAQMWSETNKNDNVYTFQCFSHIFSLVLARFISPGLFIQCLFSARMQLDRFLLRHKTTQFQYEKFEPIFRCVCFFFLAVSPFSRRSIQC